LKKLRRIGTKKYRITGNLAHQAKSKKRIDASRTVEAGDAVHALMIYRHKLRGVKKSGMLEIVEVT
jgi:hypothetical protein